MNVAGFWTRESVEATDARGRTHRGAAWGWSASTLEEARQRARRRAHRVVEWPTNLESDRAPPASGQYMYGLDRPPREEIVQEFHDAAGDTTAVITRNSYGSVVLNARDLMFVDIDLPRPKASIGKLFGSLFGKKSAAPNPGDAIRDRVRAWSARMPALGCASTGPRPATAWRSSIGRWPRRAPRLGPFSTTSAATPCTGDCATPSNVSAQGFRPSRGGFAARFRPRGFHFTMRRLGEKFRTWQRTYDEALGFATCRLVEELGSPAIHSDLAPLVELHDALSGCGRDATLA